MRLAEEIKNIPGGEKELRSFARVMGAAFLLLGVWGASRAHSTGPVFLVLALFFAALGVFCPLFLKPAHRAWMTLALMMGWVMTRVILTALFFFVVTPIGLLTRALGKDFMSRRSREKKKTYWVDRDINDNQKERCLEQF